MRNLQGNSDEKDLALNNMPDDDDYDTDDSFIDYNELFSCYRLIPKEVISRLMSILGHLMQITTLKKYIGVERYVLAETNPKC
ncbi:hypothetical protein SASPL_133689 [Salvia splendens]|uniref:Uncharacterized protein n=1 Tax=Salvia splendens TaxID=180675 RepID=A0A8X8ZIC5_SALSN|nr:hypothetical protein SASPL_133689 [Salvia splendens]